MALLLHPSAIPQVLQRTMLPAVVHLADHKPGLEREAQRVKAVGARVEFQRCWRVISTARGINTGLAVSRSLGDLDFKEPKMCDKPRHASQPPRQEAVCCAAEQLMTRCRLVERKPDVGIVALTPEDGFVVLASDGLWDVLSDQEAVDVAQVGMRLLTIALLAVLHARQLGMHGVCRRLCGRELPAAEHGSLPGLETPRQRRRPPRLSQRR